MRYVFGVRADDLPGEYNLELMYSEKKHVYRLSIETAYYFQSVDQEIEYYKSLLDEFTKWMNEMRFDTTRGITLNDICYWKARKFDSIEDAYAWFKFMVESYTLRNTCKE